jgi:hypothetical protein
MKKQVLILFTALAGFGLNSASAQTNLNFENWSGNEPNGWTSSNELTQAAGGDQTVFRETTAPGEGSSSVRLVTGSCPDCPNFEIPGLSIPGFPPVPGTSIPLPNPLGGTIQLGSFIEPGTPFTQRPISVDFRYKANPMGNDACGLHVTLTRTNGEDEDLIGEGYFEANASVSDWTNMNIPIVYYSDLQPDKMDIFATSSIGSVPDFSALGLPALPLPTPVAGSEFSIDAIVLNLPSCDDFTIALSGSNESSIGSNDGSATVTPSGGTPPYTYLWSNLETSQSISGAIPGLYTVTVTDANQCQRVGTFNISPGGCNLSVSITGNTSNSNSIFNGNGSAAISISGGNPPYEILWNTGATTESISSLAVGTYAVLVNEVNNPLCAVWAYYTVFGPNGDPTSIAENISDDNSVQIYPNPSNGIFTLKSELDFTQVEILNMLGERVYIAQVNANKTIFNLSNEAKGIYFYRLLNNTEIIKTGKIVMN